MKGCGKCFDENCVDCGKVMELGACLACRSGYSVEWDGSCQRFWRTRQGVLIISSISLTILFLLIVLVLVLLKHYLARKMDGRDKVQRIAEKGPGVVRIGKQGELVLKRRAGKGKHVKAESDDLMAIPEEERKPRLVERSSKSIKPSRLAELAQEDED